MLASRIAKRYESVTDAKATGSTYTPSELADFVAQAILHVARPAQTGPPLVVLDPAVGEGELLASLLRRLPSSRAIEVYGFDHDERALAISRERLCVLHERASLHLEKRDFLDYAMDFGKSPQKSLFDEAKSPTFDLVIANPPYVRTQILGAAQAQSLAVQFGLTGRVDLYHAFVLAIASPTASPASSYPTAS
ncbi:MAG: Eco57I restriction-modification methylase domain-containing protein [Thermoguttaceae bacterium]